MATQVTNINKAYGLQNPLQHLSPQPIIAMRAPTTKDSAEYGTQWVNQSVTPQTVYVFTNKQTWTQLAANSESASFTSLNVSGDTTLNTLETSGLTTAQSLTVTGAGLTTITGNNTTANATNIVVNNSRIGKSTLTGNSIVNTGVFTIELQNSLITATGGLLYSVSNTNVSGGGALLQEQGATQAAGSISIEVINTGGTLGTTDTITISFMVLA
jgi:hypothetical protein